MSMTSRREMHGLALTPQNSHHIHITNKTGRKKVDESNFELLIGKDKLEAVEEDRILWLDIKNTGTGTR